MFINGRLQKKSQAFWDTWNWNQNVSSLAPDLHGSLICTLKLLCWKSLSLSFLDWLLKVPLFVLEATNESVNDMKVTWKLCSMWEFVNQPKKPTKLQSPPIQRECDNFFQALKKFAISCLKTWFLDCLSKWNPAEKYSQFSVAKVP